MGIILAPCSTYQVLHPPPSLTLSSFEAHCIRLFSPISLRIAVIYRPPGPVSAFLDDFSAWLPYFLSAEIPTIILGDFNIPVNTNTTITSKLLSLTSSLDLKQWIQAPTHSNGNTLDLAFSYLCTPCNLSNNPLPLSDHHLISFALSLSSTSSPSNRLTVTRRNLRHLNPSLLYSATDHLYDKISPLSCPNQATFIYNSSLSSSLDKLAPLTTRRIRPRLLQPWQTDDTRSLRKRSRALERLWHKTKTQEDFTQYKSALLKYYSCLHTAKQTYFITLINTFSSTPRQLFSTFNTLLCPPLPPPTNTLTAQEIANHFKTKIDTIHEEITNAQKPPPCNNPCPQIQSLLPSFNPVTITEVAKLLSSTHLTTCPLDPVPSQMLRSPSDSILHSLTHIFNLNLSCGIFPNSLKHALVIPILKKPSLDPTNLNNLHPISLLSFSSKLLERLVYIYYIYWSTKRPSDHE